MQIFLTTKHFNKETDIYEINYIEAEVTPHELPMESIGSREGLANLMRGLYHGYVFSSIGIGHNSFFCSSRVVFPGITLYFAYYADE